MEPETRAAIAQLGAVLTNLTDRLTGGPPSEQRFIPKSDFRPAQSKAEALITEETRHKHQLQFQHVDWEQAPTAPTEGSERLDGSQISVLL